MKKVVVVLILILTLLVAVAGYLFLDSNYIFAGGIHSRKATQLDLRGTKIASPEKLAQLTHLTRLDLRNTGITEEQYLMLVEQLPNCTIHWSVPFQGRYYSNDSQSVSIDKLTQEEIRLLSYFPNLNQVDATNCADLDAIEALKTAYPHLSIRYSVPFGSKKLSPDTTSLTLGTQTLEDLEKALPHLPNVTQVDANGCLDYAGLLALQEQYPNCTIGYSVLFSGMAVENSTTELTIQNPVLAELETALPYLTNLETITFTGTLPANEEIHKLQVAFPNISFVWSFQLFGNTVNTAATELDLSNIPMENVQEIESVLPYFNNLQKVVMCDCGISNEEMDKLGQRNPDIRFVWTVSIGPHIRLRTDATYLMPYQYGTKLTDSQTYNLRYCVDLICIDLGHSDVSDVSFLQYMPHMKYLLLAQTQVSDISAVAGMQELEYAELFMTNIKDYSPLLSCPNLRDLNISYAIPKDISVLCQLTQLDNLYAKARWDAEAEAQLRAALPDVHIVLDAASNDSATGNGWRSLPRYYAMRDLLGMKYMED